MKMTGFSDNLKARGGTLCIIASLALLPPVIVLVDFHPGALAGCATYGYGCAEPACFIVEISTDYGATWTRDSAWIYGTPGDQIDLYVRTTISLSVGDVDGWSFGLSHDAPTLDPGLNGGDFVLNTAAVGPGVSTVQYGSPPDFESTRPWDCGVSQGVFIDFDATDYAIGPTADLVTSLVCYRVTMPTDGTVHEVSLAFTEDVGSPPVAMLYHRNGAGVAPCARDLTLHIDPTTPYSTSSYCPVPWTSPSLCPGAAGGGGGAGTLIMFHRGDVNDSGAIDISDGISILNYLFIGGSAPPCKDAADTDDNGRLEITDGIGVINYLFKGSGSTSIVPYCGLDGSMDSLDCNMSSNCPADVTLPDLSQREQHESETTVAINPNNSQNVVVVSVRWDFSLGDWRGLFRAVTFDGGDEWLTGDILVDQTNLDPDLGRPAFADPSAKFDANGNLFLVTNVSPAGFLIAVSIDGGITFPLELRKFFFADADRVTVATGPAPTADGGPTNVQSVWIASRKDDGIDVLGAIVPGVVQSLDGELDLDFKTFRVAEDNCACNYPRLAIGPKGEVIIAYNNGAHLSQPTAVPVPISIFSQVRPDVPLDVAVPQGFGVPSLVGESNARFIMTGGNANNNRDWIPARPKNSKGIAPEPDVAWDRFNANEPGFGVEGRVYLAYLDKPFTDFFTLRVNVGGPTVERKVWLSDEAFPSMLPLDPDDPVNLPRGMASSLELTPFFWSMQNSSAVAEDIRAPQEVYDRIRASADSGNGVAHEYDLVAIADGAYTVRMHFASGPSPGDTFKLAIEGQIVLDDFNPVTESGANVVFIRDFPVTVSDGNGMQIESIPLQAPGNSYEVAIEVLSSPGDEIVLRINCGGSPCPESYTIVQNEEWVSDAAFVASPAGTTDIFTTFQDPAGVSSPAPADVYKTKRHSDDIPNGEAHAFDFPNLPDGTYDVILHFSSGTAQDPETFDVSVEGLLKLDDFNPLDAAGGFENKIVTKEILTVVVTGGGGMQIVSTPSPIDEPGDSHEVAIEITYKGEVHDTDIVLLYNDSLLDDTTGPGGSSWVLYNGTGRLNTDPPGDSQLLHRMAVDQTTGKVALAWYDTRGIVPNLDLDRVRFFSTVTDSLLPLSFAPESLVLPGETASTGIGKQYSLGDYTGIDFHGGSYYPAWANNSGDDPSPDAAAEVYTQRVDVPE